MVLVPRALDAWTSWTKWLKKQSRNVKFDKKARNELLAFEKLDISDDEESVKKDEPSDDSADSDSD
jgi:hypothetical protein